MKKIYKKRIIGIVLMLAALAALFFPLQEYFGNRITHNHLRLEGFYLEKPGSLDVVVMGASEVYYGYFANEAYRNTKVTSYPYAFSHNPVTLWKYELKEILRQQKPKVLVVEVNGAGYGREPKIKHKKSRKIKRKKIKKVSGRKRKLYSELAIRILEDNMPESDNKRQMLKDLSHVRKDSMLDKCIPFLKFHGQFYDNMSEDLSEMRKRGNASMKGIFSRVGWRKQKKEIEVPRDLKSIPMDPTAEKSLKEFIAVSREMGVKNVLFVRFPHKITDEKGIINYQRYLRIKEVVEASGCQYADFTTLREEAGISSEKDFVDREHLNANGARKFTTFLSRYIQAKYRLKSTVLPKDEKEKWDKGTKYIDAYYKYYNDYPKKHSKLKMLYKTFPESISVLKGLKEYMQK